MILQFAVGLGLSALIGLVGYARGSLTGGGVLGAIFTGTIVFGAGGLVGGGLLVAFFVSSSLLSHYRSRLKAALADKFQKGSRRDLGQALANGGWAAVLALAYAITGEVIFLIGLIGALAAVTADTWSTEVGVLSARPPRLITTGREVAIGTSGGLTPLGTLTAFLGALFIGLCAVVLAALNAAYSSGRLSFSQVVQPLPFICVAGVSGLLGSLFDSLLGATVQAIYYCDYDRKETERQVHSCGRATRLVRGQPWLDNDVVNFLASVFGSLIGAVAWLILRQALS